MNLFKTKTSENIVPGDSEVCLQCKHYMVGDFCQQDNRMKKIDFKQKWKYMCSYFLLDTSGVEKIHKEHSSVTQCIKSTIESFNKICNKDDEKDNVIPIAMGQ